MTDRAARASPPSVRLDPRRPHGPRASARIARSATHGRVSASDAQLRAFEATPYAERIAAPSTYEALRLGAAHDPDAAALLFLPKADPEENAATRLAPRSSSRRVTQAANLFHELGVGPDDVVSLLLPLLPQSFFALFGAEAAGIANPVNPLLEAGQIAEILRAANTKVLVALGPLPGTDIWAKVERIRDQLPDAEGDPRRQRRSRCGAAACTNSMRCSTRQPADRLDERPAHRRRPTSPRTSTPAARPACRSWCATRMRNEVYQAWAIGLMLHDAAAAPRCCSGCRCSTSAAR